MLLETAVAAVVAGSAVCSDYFSNETRFNPIELSDYQKCVYQVHDTTSGTVGGNFWFKSGDNYVYVPLKELQGQTKAGVRNTLVQATIVQSLNDEIDELRTQIEALETAQDLLKTDMQDQIDDLQAKLDAITLYQGAIAEAEIEVNLHSGALYINGTQINKDFDSLSIPAAPNTRPSYGADNPVAFNHNAHKYTVNLYEDELVIENAPGNPNNYYHVVSVLSITMNAIHAIADQAYSDGYEDGYKDGYADGYVDGFKDGVASVTQ